MVGHVPNTTDKSNSGTAGISRPGKSGISNPSKSGMTTSGKSGTVIPSKSGIAIPGKSGSVMAGNSVNCGIAHTSRLPQQQSQSVKKSASSQGHQQSYVLTHRNGP